MSERGRRNALLAAAALLSLLSACVPAGLEDPRTMTFDPLELAPPEPERVVLENGMVLFLLPDDEVPLVRFQATIRTGSVLDPEGQEGLADLAGMVLRTGGTRGHSGEQLNELLEGIGAELEISVGRRSGRAGLSLLSEDLEEGVRILAEVLRFPRFEEGEVERAKNRKIEELRRVFDDPESIAYRVFRPALYGDGPLGRSATPASVAAVGRNDLTAFHDRYFFADRVIAGVSGDFAREELLRLWREHFGDWKGAGVPPEAFPTPSPPAVPGVSLVRKPFPQTTVLIGQFAPPLGSREYYAFSLVNYILGGSGFNSRLTREIRSNRGLAYSVGSWYSGLRGYGVTASYCRTSTETAVEVTRLMREIAEEVRLGGITQAELEWAKDSMINSLIFAVDSTAEIVSRSISYEYDGLPLDFLKRYPVRLRELSLEEVNAAARGWLRPLEAPIVAVGDARGFRGNLSEFGEINLVPLPEF